MQRIINDPYQVVEEMLQGFVKCHSDVLYAGEKNPRVIISNKAGERGRVGIVTGGGSGHKPAFIGYCGRNMVDAVAVGEIFSSPSAKNFLDAFRAADSGAGVACLYGNYSGDNMNVKMAREMAEEEGITVKTVIANDDVASAPSMEREKRRGVAGEIFMWKIGGAAAADGKDLDGVIAAAQDAMDHCRSIAVGLGPCTIPANGKPNFLIEPGTLEFGIGHHGEPGMRVAPLSTANEMARDMTTQIVEDLPYENGDEVAVLVSGLGATPVMEQYIFYNAVQRELDVRGISVYRAFVGNYFTSLDMNGVTLTLMKLDDKRKRYLDWEVETVGMKVVKK